MRLVAAILVVLSVLFVGMWLGGHSGVLPDDLAELVADDDVATMDAAIRRIHDDYYRPVPRDELTDEALRGAVRGLDDRFSSYFDPDEYQRFREITDARFSGIGVSVVPHERGLRVDHVYARSPARRAGLREGDVIIAANGTNLADKPEEAATGLIRGRPGTTVTLIVRRDGKELHKRVERAKVTIPVVESERRRVHGRTYAVVRLDQFSSGAHAELYSAVRRARRDRVRGLVLDLRHNAGGLVEEARLVASAFLPDGKVVTTRGRTVPEKVYTATGDPVAPTLPMVVLVDRATASAAEIVAGALQDRDRARVVGTKTFGKGVFQEVVELVNGGALDLTVGQYFLPSGRNLGGPGVSRGAGLTPDVPARDDRKTRRDEALDRALAVLGGSSRA